MDREWTDADETAAMSVSYIDDLRKASAPFAMLGGPWDSSTPAFHDLPDDADLYENSGRRITAGDVRRLREALATCPEK